ncbi:MAG: hypothetical protein AAFO07_20095 [Bacteroidota bacterium]
MKVVEGDLIKKAIDGDLITFDQEAINGNPVIYLSHDDDDLHGAQLGDNFVDFISKWANLGCVGTEAWQFEPFYDYENKLLKSEGKVIDDWKTWLLQ